jgi:Flp pilus assembly pilin Flp
MRSQFRHESGQASGEYAIVVGAIAIVCLAAALFLGYTFRDRYGSTAEPVSGAPFEPPFPSTLSWPSTVEECEDDGWRSFAQFTDEEACTDYVASLSP